VKSCVSPTCQRKLKSWAFYFVALKKLVVLTSETSANKGYLSAHIFVNLFVILLQLKLTKLELEALKSDFQHKNETYKHR